MAPNVEGSDTYPISINKSSLRPGTIYYDPNGHVLIVYKIEKDGTIRLLDGHPDNSLTLQTFSSKFRRGASAQGGGFKNFRPYVQNGSEIIRLKNSDILDFSGTDQYRSSYKVGTSSVNYYEWIKAKMSGQSQITYRPLEYLKTKTLDICSQFKERAKSVERAVNSGVSAKEHPEELLRIYLVLKVNGKLTQHRVETPD